MILHPIDLTSALRPALLPDETLLFVQDKVGLYSGNLKHADYQNGQIYLTSHRICYVDNDEPREKAVAVQLKDVERCELYAGFLKSSPKVTLHPKAAKQFGQVYRTSQNPNGTFTPATASSRPQFVTSKPTAINATWICPICSFSNPVPPTFDPATANDRTPLVPCGTCGMTPPLVTLVKAALAVKRTETPRHIGTSATQILQPTTPGQASICPRCTFENHLSMTSCEICGAPLDVSTPEAPEAPIRWEDLLSESPEPATPAPAQKRDNPNESTKFSFRAGGEKIFLERLKGALVQRKWMLQEAPLEIPIASSAAPPTPHKNIGISGLERRDSEQRKNNEIVIGNAFEDLSALMASAKEIIALAETFAKSNSTTNTNPSSFSTPDASQTDQATHLLSSLNLTTTKDMLGSSSSSSASAQHTTYLSQLARSITDFLLDDSSGNAILKSSGGIISLVDLWAVYNRARGGVELVSPMDFSEAVDMFEKLRLPVQARVFRGSGLRVVRGSEWSDERVVKALISWLRDLRRRDVMEGLADGLGMEMEQSQIGVQWGRGVTALEAADRFGWSVGVASEELAMAEERGALCRDVGLEGIKFWENWFGKDLSELAGLD